MHSGRLGHLVTLKTLGTLPSFGLTKDICVARERLEDHLELGPLVITGLWGDWGAGVTRATGAPCRGQSPNFSGTCPKAQKPKGPKAKSPKAQKPKSPKARSVP